MGFVLLFLNSISSGMERIEKSDSFLCDEEPSYSPDWDCNDPLGISGIPNQFRRRLQAGGGNESVSNFGCMDIRHYPRLFKMNRSETVRDLPGLWCGSSDSSGLCASYMPIRGVKDDPCYYRGRLCFFYTTQSEYLKNTAISPGVLCFPEGVTDAQWHLGPKISGRIRLNPFIDSTKGPIYIKISKKRWQVSDDQIGIPPDSTCNETGICVNPSRDSGQMMALYTGGRIDAPSFLHSDGYVNSNCSEFLGEDTATLYHVQLDFFKKWGQSLASNAEFLTVTPYRFVLDIVYILTLLIEYDMCIPISTPPRTKISLIFSLRFTWFLIWGSTILIVR